MKITSKSKSNLLCAADIPEAHSLLPLLPPFLRVLSVGIGVTSSEKRQIESQQLTPLHVYDLLISKIKS